MTDPGSTPPATSTTRGLDHVRHLGQHENWLATLITLTPGGGIHTALINAAPFPHPSTGAPCLALVSYGRSAKLRNIRHNPDAALHYRSGWDWVTAHGTAEIIGPDDPHPDIDGTALTQLLRDIYHAAGGRHSDLDRYDEVMTRQRRAAVLLTPTRFSSN